jgi:hypothetical protein
MDCLGSDDVVHDVTIELRFLCVGPCRGYITQVLLQLT